MRKYLVLFVFLFVSVACTKQPIDQGNDSSSSSRPSQIVAAEGQGELPPAPQGDFFYSLPTHEIGEVVTLGGYTAILNSVELTDNQLHVDLSLANNSGKPIDLVWAVQLFREEQGYVLPSNSPVSGSAVGESYLTNNDDLGGVWTYDLAPAKRTDGDLKPQAEIDLDDYRLLFVPFGWSGPIFIFRLNQSM